VTDAHGPNSAPPGDDETGRPVGEGEVDEPLTSELLLETEHLRVGEPDEGDDPSADPGPDGDAVTGTDHLAYDCASWAGETRSLLRSLLVSNGIRHAWQGTTLHVREEDEAEVDALVDEVAGSALPALDPDAPKVIYEVAEWPVSLLTQLAEALTQSDVAYEWDERGDLVVLEADEERVGVLLDDLPEADESEIASDDGVAVHELLDAVFLSSGRLARNGSDASGTVALVEAAAVIEQVAVPFGFEPAQWRHLVGLVQQLRDSLEGEDSDAEVASTAATVRDLVRRYI
jgi:hypothetical protein